MKYTVRFAHLRDKPDWKVGDTVERGDVIGIMGGLHRVSRRGNIKELLDEKTD